MDPQVLKDKIPSYEIVEEKIKQIDGSIIILRIFYIFDHMAYKFQLIRNNKLCMVEIPKKLLDDLKRRGSTSEKELTEILDMYVQNSSCWTKV